MDLDISSSAIDYVRDLGLQAEQLELSKLNNLSNVVVAMWEVIEHVWEVSDYLNSIRKAVGEKGFLILSTPNFHRKAYRLSNNWGQAMAPPIHINFFTEVSLRNCLDYAGFNNVKIIKPRIYRPNNSLDGFIYSIQIALGIEPTKTLYAIAN